MFMEYTHNMHTYGCVILRSIQFKSSNPSDRSSACVRLIVCLLPERFFMRAVVRVWTLYYVPIGLILSVREVTRVLHEYLSVSDSDFGTSRYSVQI